MNHSQMIPRPSYSKELETFSEIYLLLGVIEIELRLRVPSTLGSGNSSINWFDYFVFDTYPNLQIYQSHIPRKRIALFRNGSSESINFETKSLITN